VADPDGALARTLGVEGDALVLLRPDGYLGAISDAGDAATIEGLLEVTSSRRRGTAR
jgi:hypothetical protein